MKNNVSLYLLFAFMLCMGCEGKKEEGREQICEYVRYHTINEKDFSVWDGLVDENDLTLGPHGNPRKGNVIITAETAAMVGEALIRSALHDKHVKENLKIVIDRGKYWVVQGTAGSNQESVFIAVIQKSNGKVLDFRVVEK